MPRIAPFLPDTAPFTAEQRAWLNGFFAGVSVESQAPSLPGWAGDGFSTSLPAISSGEERLEESFDRTNPFPARVLFRRRLNAEGSAKDTRHVEISLERSGLHYEPGDALGVVPQNCPELVGCLIEALGLTEDATVRVEGESSTLLDVLSSRRDITSVSDEFLEAVTERSGNRALREQIESDRRRFVVDRDYVDVLDVCSGARFEPQELVDLLRPLQHRLYSIASSPHVHPGEVHLTVGVVRYSVRDRLRKGVCSTYLSERVLESDSLPVFVHRNPNFHLPEDDRRPIVMIGPGTGIAPFRAFLEQRRAAGAKGRNWLFFGDQHAATDFLYRDELEEMVRSGVLHRLCTAFSRDQAEKVYVQHRMLEHAGELYAWLEDGAHVYVCGDASRMAKDVDAALHKAVRIAGGMSTEESADYVKRLKREKRYARDVY